MATAIAPIPHTNNVSLAVPITQNTAPVLEFKCLFTNDIRRKQKRWQDGRLKFHAFNKRIRVFDDRSGVVGETHFQEDYAFEEGEELVLDQRGVLVQVGECVARGEQDLSELIDKRIQAKEKRREARAAAAAAAPPLTAPARTAGALSFSGVTPAIGTFQARPKSLGQVLGTPSGHHGRAALPTRSPFEERRWHAQQSGKEIIEERPAKRRKPEPVPSRAGYAQNLTGATLNLSTPTSTPGLRFEAIQPRSIIKHRYPESIDLTSDEIHPANSTVIATSNLTRDSNGVRVTKAHNGNRVIEKRKPEKSGYAENLTGASLTLSGTYGRPRAISGSNDNALPKPSRILQRLTGSEIVRPTLSKKVNLPSREHNESEEMGSIDQMFTNPRGKRASDPTMDDEGFVEINSSPAGNAIIETSISDNPSRSTSNKRPKTSQRKSISTRKFIGSEPPQSVIPSKAPSEVSSLQRPNEDTSKAVADEAAALAAVRLRPLRIRTGTSRCMLISASRSSSYSSVESTKPRGAEVIKTKQSSNKSKSLEAIPTRLIKSRATVPPEQETYQTNGLQSTRDVFDDHSSFQNVKSTKHLSSDELLELSCPPLRTNAVHLVVLEESSRQPSPWNQIREARTERPPSSPEFEGFDYQAIDTLLCRTGNASPFAPKELRKAIEQEKSPLQPTRIRNRPSNAAISHLTSDMPSKLSGPSSVKENTSTVTVSEVDYPQQVTVANQNEIPQTKNTTAASNKPTTKKSQRASQDSTNKQPKIKESSSAFAIPLPLPPPSIPQESITIPPNPNPSKLTPSPNPINLKTTPLPPAQEPSNSTIETPPNLVLDKPDQPRANTSTEDPAPNQPANLDIPSPPPPPPQQPPPTKSIIPNPATRGKKAAQKTDAAGMVPILEPIFPHPIPTSMPRQKISGNSMGRVHSAGGLSNVGVGAGFGMNIGIGAGMGNRNRESNTGIGNGNGNGNGNDRVVMRRRETGGEGMGAGGGARGGKGPWGKEAFDLFDWRPPRLRGDVGVGGSE